MVQHHARRKRRVCNDGWKQQNNSTRAGQSQRNQWGSVVVCLPLEHMPFVACIAGSSWTLSLFARVVRDARVLSAVSSDSMLGHAFGVMWCVSTLVLPYLLSIAFRDVSLIRVRTPKLLLAKVCALIVSRVFPLVRTNQQSGMAPHWPAHSLLPRRPRALPACPAAVTAPRSAGPLSPPSSCCARWLLQCGCSRCCLATHAAAAAESSPLMLLDSLASALAGRGRTDDAAQRLCRRPLPDAIGSTAMQMQADAGAAATIMDDHAATAHDALISDPQLDGTGPLLRSPHQSIAGRSSFRRSIPSRVSLSVALSSSMTSSFATKKIFKAAGSPVSALEESVAKAFMELEITSKEMSAELRDLYFLSAKEVEAPGNKTAIIVFVPFRQHKKFLKLQSRLIRELEKKFSGKHVTIVAQRTILSPAFSRAHPGQLRPRSRTLTAVHSAVLEDIVYPTQIVGRRTRFRADGTRLLKVYLDPKVRRNHDTTDARTEWMRQQQICS